jgi:hypothetical protein
MEKQNNMILEGAFYKLPELLLGHDFPRRQYEATLASHLAMAVLLELNARNIPMPQSRIHVERPYPLEKAGPANRADLYVDLKGVSPGLHLPHYGVKDHNWIEVKFHASIGRGAGSEPKVENAGRILQDLLRLCLFVKELESKTRDNTRYFLVVFNREPGAYLAFQRRSQSGQGREWLRQLLSPGRHQLEVSLQGETATFIRTVGAGLAGLADSLEMTLDVVTYAFEPTAQPSEVLYQGYLVRIINFTIRLGLDKLIYDDSSNTKWTDEQVSTQRTLAERMLGLEV